jgi:hypothetical protein
MDARFENLSVVAIFFWGRAGSVFVQSLFDSHPDVLTIPASRLNGFHRWQWERISREPSIEAMARCFIECNASVFDGRDDRWFEGLGALGPARDTPLWVDAEAFVRHLASVLVGSEVTRRRFFLAAHVAYALARGQDVSKRTTIIYQLHSAEAFPAVEAALQDFPHMRAIGTTREPIRSMLSYLRKNVLVARAWSNTERSSYAQLAPSGAYNFVYRHQLSGWRELMARQGPAFFSLRIEDVNRDIEGQMRTLAAWLNLRWDPCLTESTFNGLVYNGETPPVEAGAAPSPEESDAALDALDRYVLEGLLWRFRREFDYGRAGALQCALAPLLLLLPTRLERLALRERLACHLAYLRRRHAAATAGAGENIGASAGIASGRARATLKNMLVRQSFSYRHLLCEVFPELRARLPLPRPLAAGLSLPERPEPEPRVTNGASRPARRLALVTRSA